MNITATKEARPTHSNILSEPPADEQSNEIVEYWRQHCKEHPLGDADTPEKQIQYFREIGADEYADNLVRILLGLSADQPVPQDYRANTERS